MKNDMINDFIDLCKNNKKIAIIDKRHRISFEKFYSDCLKMKKYLNHKIPKGENILVFIYPYSYLFYVAMFAGFLSGLNLVILDSFSDKKRNKLLLNNVKCKYALVDQLTSMLSFKLPKMNLIKINHFCNYDESNEQSLEGSITTFTSGTTGIPHPIKRSIEYLFKQEEFIKNNIEIDKDDIVYCGLPMYTVLSIYLGNTTIIEKGIKGKPTVLLTSIKRVLKFKKSIDVKKCFLGGAILYPSEARYIKSILPNSNVNYVYGATESALIYKTTLDKYLCESFSFDEPISGVRVKIKKPNQDGIGEIFVSGNIVIGDEEHSTGDIGKIENGKLYIYGRKKYSIMEKGLYNYQIDEEVRRTNKSAIEAFSFRIDDKIHVVYKGIVTEKNPMYIYHKLRKLAYDPKHKTKLNYSKMIDKIK